MIPQPFPLYAIDPRTSTAYVVVGWRGWPNDVSAVPVLAPIDAPGHVAGVPTTALVYGTDPPVRTMPTPAPDETVVMAAPVPWPPR